LHYARPSGNHAEAAVGPTGDAGIGEETEDDTAAIAAEIVDGVAVRSGGDAQQIGFEAGNLELLLGLGRPGQATAQGSSRG